MATAMSNTVIEALGRAAVYGLLARAFAYPTPAHRAAITETAAALNGVPPLIQRQAEALARDLPAPDELAGAFTRLFTHSASRDCPLYETAYTAAEIFQQAQQMADIGGFYAAFGVEPAAGVERPDHITTELEFMGFLATKEAYAATHLGAARVRQSRRAQRLFLQDHLACWGPAFGLRVAALDPEGWHGRAGHLLAAWLVTECRAFAVTPSLLLDHSATHWPEPETGECGLDEILEADACQGCPFDAGTSVAGQAAGVHPGTVPLPVLNL